MSTVRKIPVGHLSEKCAARQPDPMARNSRVDDREEEGIPATAECLRMIGLVVLLGSAAMVGFVKFVQVVQ